MQRDLSITIGVLGFIVVVAILLFSSNNGNGLSLSGTDQLPTGFIMGATQTVVQTPITTPLPTISTTPPLITSASPTPTITATPSVKPSTTTTPTVTPVATCKTNATFQKAKILANQFMSKHKIKAGYEVLQLISPPESDDDIEKLAYWMGEDDPNQTIQLYQTTSTSYTTVSYVLGTTLTDRGDHKEIRGTKLCELPLHEKRSSIDGEGIANDTDTPLYLDFSLSVDGELLLTAFKDSRNGTKYSGFD